MGIFPKWLKEFSFADMWGGIKEDVTGATKHVGTGVKSILSGVRGVLTPTLIWVAIIIIVGLIFWKQIQKTIKI